MKYIRVKWEHTFDNEPVELISELDEALQEVRKIEVFRDGRKGFASKAESTGGTRLSLESLPSLAEIASDPQFKPAEISKREFEEAWSNRHPS